MKKIILFPLCMLLCGAGFTAFAQEFRGLDQSPLDVAYFPDNYAHDRKEGDKAKIKVVYSRPQKKDRTVFGTLVPYGKVWRTGANEATEIRFFEDVMVEGKPLKAGTYALFTIPEKDEWTIIFSSDLDYWGAYSYNEAHDVLRVKAPVRTLDKPVEAFAIQFSDKGDNEATMQLAWDNTVAEVDVKVKK